MLKKNGFSLIELMIVITIIGILTAVIVVSVYSTKNKAKDTKVKTALSQVRVQQELYYKTNGKYADYENDIFASTPKLGTAQMKSLILEARENGSLEVYIYVDGPRKNYAVTGSLPSTKNPVKYYCGDALGANGVTQVSLETTTSAQYKCPPDTK